MTAIETTLPFSAEAEDAVLGSILINPEAFYEVSDFLKTEDFFIHRNRQIWDAMKQLLQDGSPLDLITVCAELEKGGHLEEAGGASRISALISAVPTSLNVTSYARIIEDRAARRRILSATGNIARWAYDESLDLNDLTGRCVEELNSAVQDPLGQGLVHISAGLSAMYDEMQQAESSGEMPGIPSGIEGLDILLGNLKPGLIVVAGRPGQGKTSLKHTIARNVAGRGRRVAVFSLEMSLMEVAQRLTTAETGIDLSLIRAAKLEAQEWASINRGVEVLEQLPIYVDETPDLNVGQIEARCKRLEMTVGPLDLIIVDYLQLVSSPFKATEPNRAIAVGAVARGLRVLSRKLNVPVLAGAQLNRESEKENRRPKLSDLRESGEIENEAHVVMFLFHDEQEHTTEIIVAKHRNGPTGSAPVVFQKTNTRFVSA